MTDAERVDGMMDAMRNLQSLDKGRRLGELVVERLAKLVPNNPVEDAPMTDAELADLERLCEAATPGEWSFTPCRIGHPDNAKNHVVTSGATLIARLFSEAATLRGMLSTVPADQAEANAHFIAAARTALPALLAEVRRLRAALQEEIEGHYETATFMTEVVTENDALRGKIEGEPK